MTLSQSLTSLGDAVRADYLITDKLSIDEMTSLLSGKNELEKGLGDDPFDDGVDIAKGSDSYTLTGKVVGARIALNLAGQISLKGKTLTIYFQASTDDADGVPLQLGPMSGKRISLTVKAKDMTGYYITLTFTTNNSLSIVFYKAASIKIKSLRAWLV